MKINGKRVKNSYFASSRLNSLNGVEIMTMRQVLGEAFFDADLVLTVKGRTQACITMKKLEEIKNELFKDIHKGEVVLVTNFNKLSRSDKAVVFNLLNNGLIESIRENEQRLNNAISSDDEDMVIDFYKVELLYLNKIKELFFIESRIKERHYKKLNKSGFTKVRRSIKNTINPLVYRLDSLYINS